MESVTFGVLGALAADRDGTPLALGGRRQRTVLAVLLLNRNRAVSRERIIDSVWEDDPPETARNTVQVYVSTLRRTLGADRLVTEPGGYRLVVEPHELDAALLEQRLAEATRAIAAGEPHAAVAALDQALALWRGPALGDLAGDSSRWPRRPGSRACGWPRASCAPRPSSCSAGSSRRSPSSRRCCARSRCASTRGRS